MTGMICRMDNSGLSFQTQRLARLLKPDKIMLIDSTPFNGNPQHPERFTEYNSVTIEGFPTNEQILKFLRGLKSVLSCEMFYSNHFTQIARSMRVKTICIANPEFWDYFTPRFSMVSLPDKVIVPSMWMMDEMKEFNAQYLPTPIFKDEFAEARETNLKRKGTARYLFINGKSAVHDRNGLFSLYDALKLSRGKFNIVIKSQDPVIQVKDRRVSYDFSDPENPSDLYRNFDMLILPRRYGGQALPMCEALQSALPVIMTDVEPNNKTLPPAWLVPAKKTGEFMARTMIDIYSANPEELALALDTYSDHRVIDKRDWYNLKQKACQLSEQFSAEKLRPEYEKILE